VAGAYYYDVEKLFQIFHAFSPLFFLLFFFFIFLCDFLFLCLLCGWFLVLVLVSWQRAWFFCFGKLWKTAKGP